MAKEYVTRDQLEQRLKDFRLLREPFPDLLSDPKDWQAAVDFLDKARARVESSCKRTERLLVHPPIRKKAHGPLGTTRLVFPVIAGALFFLSLISIWPKSLGKRGANG